MSEDTAHHDPLDLNKNGCRRWAVFIGLILAILLAMLIYVSFPCDIQAAPLTIIKDLKVAITAFEMDSAHFPIPESDWNGRDVTLRTRGRMVTALLGHDPMLNPKNIKFIDCPEARDHKGGLWQDGTEWVLSDRWGEPYYVVLDTNKDNEIANPELGADPSDSAHEKRSRENPPPQMLHERVLIYSSGRDRDPKTWRDNVCSWGRR